MSRPAHTRADFAHSPMIVFYETTRACDLACKHCRADAQRECDPDELSTTAAQKMIADLARFPKPPLLVLTGGDPIKRRDVFELIAFARGQGLEVAMTPSATPLWLAALIAGLVGAHVILAIGGADMPVIVSVLNSASGWAAAAISKNRWAGPISPSRKSARPICSISS